MKQLPKFFEGTDSECCGNCTHRCFDCLWYSMWTGSCFNPSAQRCITEEECIADLETCDQFEYYNPATRYD